MKRQTTLLPISLVGLAAALTAVAVLGPLGTELVRYRYSATMINQAIGLDAFAVLFVVPVVLAAAALAARQHPAAPLIALGPAGFALYMSVQYVIGPEYLVVDGNGERAFLLFVGVFVVSAVVLCLASASAAAPEWSGGTARRRGVTLLVLAAFVVLAMYVSNGFLAAMTDFPAYVAERAAASEYDEHPTAYWIVAFLDLAVVVPLTVAVGVGLLRGTAWARPAFYGVIGWYALVPPSVAAMAVVMVVRDDPAADAGKAVVLVVAAVVLMTLAGVVFRPLSRRPDGRRAHVAEARSGARGADGGATGDLPSARAAADPPTARRR